MPYNQKEKLLFRITAIALLAVILFPYAFGRPNPVTKDLLVALVAVLGMTSAFVVSKRIGKQERSGADLQSPGGKDRTWNVAPGLVLVCLGAVMWLIYGIRVVYGSALPAITLVPAAILATIGLALLVIALIKRRKR